MLQESSQVCSLRCRFAYHASERRQLSAQCESLGLCREASHDNCVWQLPQFVLTVLGLGGALPRLMLMMFGLGSALGSNSRG